MRVGKNEGHVLPALGARTVHRARLEHAGVDYEAAFPDNWKELKPTTPWGALPLFEAPLAGKVLTLGHELAILAYIERKCPAVAGADEREWAVSQQFVHQAEDV